MPLVPLDRRAGRRRPILAARLLSRGPVARGPLAGRLAAAGDRRRGGPARRRCRRMLVAAARHAADRATCGRKSAQIAEGRFEPVALPDARRRNPRPGRRRESDGPAARTSMKQATRHSERLRTLGTLGGGIAHQIRNAATGCRIALDLHQRDCPLASKPNGHADEPLAVAVRQLDLIESHIQRFLTLGRPQAAARSTAVDLAEVVRAGHRRWCSRWRCTWASAWNSRRPRSQLSDRGRPGSARAVAREPARQRRRSRGPELASRRTRPLATADPVRFACA